MTTHNPNQIDASGTIKISNVPCMTLGACVNAHHFLHDIVLLEVRMGNANN